MLISSEPIGEKNLINTTAFQVDNWFISVLQSCTDGIWELDPQNYHFTCSPQFKRILGYTPDENIAENEEWWEKNVHADDFLRLKDYLTQALQSTKAILTVEVRLLTRRGDYLQLFFKAQIMRNAQGKPIRIAGIVIDTTPHKQLLGQLHKIIKQQEEEAHVKSRFISTLNHEIRSPLSGIIGMLSLLRDTNLNEEQKRYADNIHNSSELLLQLVNDILDVSKIASGKLELECINFSLSEVASSSIELVRPQLLKKSLTCTLDLDMQIDTLFSGDPLRLQQILINLLSNAAKFTSKGGITVTIRKQDQKTASEREKGKTIIYFGVIDTGIGIAEEYISRLFSDFTQAYASINRQYGGTGLGLSICKELVKLMGGSIGVDSREGFGSTFWFTVPLDKALIKKEEIIIPSSDTSVEMTHNATPNHPKPAAPPHYALKILVAEDNQVNQEVMCGLISKLGDNVIIASNGQIALDFVHEQHFDVILMDVNMPVMDGLTATAKIREIPDKKNIPIIGVTANTFTGDRENCLKSGMNDVINKPVSKKSLEKVLSVIREQVSAEKISLDPMQKEGEIRMLVNYDVINELKEDLGEEVITRLLSMYRDDAIAIVEQLSVPNISFTESRDHAHTLAGMSENLGIQLVGTSAREIMKASHDHHEAIPALIEKLKEQFALTLQELDRIMPKN